MKRLKQFWEEVKLDVYIIAGMTGFILFFIALCILIRAWQMGGFPA